MKPRFLKPIGKSDKIESVEATSDDVGWKEDNSGYFLIKVDKKAGTIKVGFCDKGNKLCKEIYGREAKEICHAVIKRKLLSEQMHAAYLGRELEKAEIALKNNLDYVQDKELELR